MDLISSCHNTARDEDGLRLPRFISNTEILTKIFSLLPLTDRKNARLVSWDWYRAASHYSIRTTEKLVCVNDYSPKKVFTTLSKGVHGWPHLQFLGFHIDRTSNRLWKKYGDQVHSLEFVSCKFSGKAAKSVIGRCSNLKSLSMRNCSGFFSCDVFDHCTKKGIVRSSLESISVENDADIRDSIFLRTYEVFPQLKGIAVGLYNDRRYNYRYNEIYCDLEIKEAFPTYESKRMFSHSAVYERLRKSADLMHNLKYVEVDRDVCHSNHVKFFEQIFRIEGLKLKSLFFSPSAFNIPNELTLKSFFQRQNMLEHVVLEKCFFSSESCGVLLDNCVNLRFLELNDMRNNDLTEEEHATIIFSQEIMDKFVNSKLESLKLRFNFEFEESMDVPSFENNTTLHTLSINSSSLREKNVSMLMEAFQGLRNLDLSNCNLDDALMQTILKCQVNLESLVLCYNKDLTDFAMTGRPLKLEHYMTSKDTFSISRLTKLKILNLRACSKITAHSLQEMILPELRYLSLQECRNISFDGFQILGENCPLLEFLDLSHTTISPESVIKLYRQLKRLYALDIAFCAIDELSKRVLMSCSQSLRFLRHTSNQYYFNIFSKQWKATETRIRVEANDGKIEKLYGLSSHSVVSPKMFSCFHRCDKEPSI